MKRKKHTPEPIVAKLRRTDILLGEGQSVAKVVQALEVTEATYSHWRKQHGGTGRQELRELERENARLRRLVADQALDLTIAKDVLSGTV